MLREHHHRAADELGDGLRARAAQQRCESGDLDVIELAHIPVVVGDLRGDQPADHVVLRIFAPLLDQAVVVHGGVDVGLHVRFTQVDLTRFALQALVDPVPDLLAEVLGHAGHAR